MIIIDTHRCLVSGGGGGCSWERLVIGVCRLWQATRFPLTPGSPLSSLPAESSPSMVHVHIWGQGSAAGSHRMATRNTQVIHAVPQLADIMALMQSALNPNLPVIQCCHPECLKHMLNNGCPCTWSHRTTDDWSAAYLYPKSILNRNNFI